MELRRKRAPISPKSSRLHPSEPLHMTTRAASKAASNGSNSRRGSLISAGQVSPGGSHDQDAERYSKRRRVSTGSKTTPTKGSQSSHSGSTESRMSTRSMSGGNLPAIQETLMMTRKRKRASDATAENISVASGFPKARNERRDSNDYAIHSPPEAKKQPIRKVKRASLASREEYDPESVDDVADETQLKHNETNKAREHEPEVANAIVTRENISNHMQNAAIGITDANGEGNERDPGNTDEKEAESTETPTTGRRDKPSNMSSASSSSSQKSSGTANDSSNDFSIEQDAGVEADADAEEDEDQEDADMDASLDIKDDEVTASLEMAVPTMDPTPAESAQVSPAGSPPDSNLDQESPVKRTITSAPGEAAGIEDGRVKKKLPGRRRAPHANPKVEAALRRQLHLRMNYRAVAKVLKPILAELGHRSLSSLENNIKAHEEAVEYPGVKEGLHQRFEQRLAWVQKHKDLSKRKLKDTFEAEVETRRQQHQNIVQNIQEAFVVRLQHDFLNAVRRHDQAEDGHASDDEADDVIPPLRHATSKGTVRHILGPEFHWRSRPTIETERLFGELYQRHEVFRQRQEHDEQPGLEESHPFTTFDPTIRDAANGTKNIETLMQALEQAQHEPVQPPPAPIPNSEAHGLQALANLSAAAAATEAAVRKAMARSKIEEEETARKKSEEAARPSPLSVPKPSLSQPPEPIPRSTPSNVPTPAQTPQNDSRWLPEGVKFERARSVREPSVQPSRTASSFSQVALAPSLTETAPPMAAPTYGVQAPPIQIPGLNNHVPPIQIPGLSNFPPPTSTGKTPTPQHSSIPDPPTHQTVLTRASGSKTPAPTSSVHASGTPAPSLDHSAFGPSQESTPSHMQSPSQSSASNQRKDFWSSLARGTQENGAAKARLAPKGLAQQPITAQNSSSTTPSHPFLDRSGPSGRSSNHPLDHPLERPLDRQSDRPLGPHSEASRDRASSKGPSTPSTTVLEPLSQRLRSTSDSFGPFLDKSGSDNTKPKKRAPKTSVGGPWPRSRNYDPARNSAERRATMPSSHSNDGYPPMHTRAPSGYGTPDYRHHQPYHTSPPHQAPSLAPYSTPGSYPPQSGPYAPPIPPPAAPYGYDHHISPYGQPPYRAPTGYSDLPGPPPMSQPQGPTHAYYGPPIPPSHAPYAPAGPPPMTSRPSTYGSQYGGQPILPANSHAPGGYNGPHGSPTGAHAGPAFSQYPHRDEGRRSEYGRGGRGGRHNGGPGDFRYWNGPR